MSPRDPLLDRAAELLMEGMGLHDIVSKEYLGHDVLAVAIQCHFVRVTVQGLDPGVWEAAGEIVEGFMKAKDAQERKDSGVN